MRVLLTEKRVQQILQGAATAQNARLHCAYAAFQNFGDFLVAETLEIAKNHSTAKYIGNFIERGLHYRLNFARCELVEWSGVHIFNFQLGLAFFRFRVNRNIFLQMTLEPAAVIQGFTNSDAIQPGLQRTTLAKAANAFEGLKKNFLRAVGSIAWIRQHAQDQVVHRGMVMRDEDVES